MKTTLLAMVKTKGGGSAVRKMLSEDSEIFDRPNDLEQNVGYNSDTLLEESQWYSISEFSKSRYCHDFMRKRSPSVDYDSIGNDHMEIIFICGIQGDMYYFQRTTSSKQVLKKGLVRIGSEWRYQPVTTSIAINEPPQAIYDSAIDTLYFHELSKISAIFPGINDLFREATNDEVKEFLGLSFMHSNGFAVEDVGIENRRRVVKALSALKTLSEDDRNRMIEYIRRYCPELAYGDGVRISNDGDLKKVLYGLQERYHTTPIGNERRVANSITPMNGKG